MILDEEDYLAHYGTPRHSGRYPWGSGGNVSDKRHMDLIDHIVDMSNKGISEPDIAKGLNMSTAELRDRRTIANNAIKQSRIILAQGLRDKGTSNVEIGKRMGIPESSVRALLAPGELDRAQNLHAIANMLKEQVGKDNLIDVGSGVEAYFNVSKEKLRTATQILKDEGYVVHSDVPVRQAGTEHDTKFKVLAAPGTTQKEVFLRRHEIQQVPQISSSDGGRTFTKIHEPISLDPTRVTVRYKEDGGGEADGVIFVRPGVDDLSLGSSRYAQVRVKVGEDHYLKGMAMYKDGMPPGTDVIFNTNKTSTGNKLDAMKTVESDKAFPFGTVVRQIKENEGTDKEKVTSVMNLVNEEGDWGKWSKTLSSQFLSKQSPSLAKQQLNKTFEQRKKDFDEINSLTNPTVKKKLLNDFSESTDSAAVSLKAATFPGSAHHAILPLSSIKPTEVYAPNYADGTNVVLIRHPHGGTFEIPQLTVNNRNREGKTLLGDVSDAVGIHPDVAKQLSGADFDGDTVLVIPNQPKIKSSHPLEALKNFDPIHEYPGYEGMPKINKQTEMGKISNLITDMTLKGAPNDQLVRAIKHSMVVIDAEKHNLNYRESERRNGIKALKAEYQGSASAGASTLISRKKQKLTVPEVKRRLQSHGGPIDLATGRVVFEPTGATKIKTTKSGEKVRVQKTSHPKVLSDTTDAHTLSSGTRIEGIYADHSNRLKDLANQARLTLLRTPKLHRIPSASKVYDKEVQSLNSKLSLVIMNRPRERAAQATAAATTKALLDSNPDLTKEKKKKIRFSELEKARARHGAKQKAIEFTQDEWNAVQAGAISENKLKQILDKADMNQVRKLATPRREILMTPTQTSRATAMLRSGATRIEVARALGVSLSTLDNATTSS